MTTPREDSIAQARHLISETERVQRRLAVQKEHLDQLNEQWRGLIGESVNQHAKDAAVILADGSHHADLAGGRCALAADQMQRWVAQL